jgi:RNA polymerase sigma-70 factor (ECF subfamily)
VSVARDRLRIGEALAQLSAADRDVLRRSCYEGRTTAQIAEDLHIADDTVKSTLHHTVRALRRTLQEMEVPNRWTSRPS